MVKIIKRNNKVKCNSCFSILRYENGDIINIADRVYERNYIVCPVCKNNVILSSNYIDQADTEG